MKYLLLLIGLLSACGTEIKQTQAVEGNASIEVRISISFPECAGIQDESLRVECIKAAAEIAISINGGLSEDQQAILDDLDDEVAND